MALTSWLLSLSDEMLVDWANKGLLRRASKALDKQDLSLWLVSEEEATGLVDGFELKLKGVGLHNMQCNCPATTTCYHMLVFCLGLRQSLRTQNIITLPRHASSDDLGDVQENTKPWLVQDEKQAYRLFGKANWDRAQLWALQGVSVNAAEHAHGLVAEVEADKSYRVSIPTVEGIGASICSCKKEKCAHRALVCLTLSTDAGFLANRSPIETLSETQRQTTVRAESWLQALLLRGLASLSTTQVKSGLVLATELTQADMPRLGKLMKTLLTTLQDELNNQWLSSPNRIRQPVTELLGLLTALRQRTLPAPLLQLIGVHRRAYKLKKGLILVGLTPEFWQTLSGYEGYSLYFWAPHNNRYYAFSETRNRATYQTRDNWNSYSAWQTGMLGGKSLRDLCGRSFTLLKGWCTDEGRISGRDGTLLHVEDNKPMITEKMAQPLCHLVDELGGMILATPFSPPPTLLKTIKITQLQPLKFDRFSQTWQGEGVSTMHQRFNHEGTVEKISFSIQIGGRDHDQQQGQYFNNLADKAEALFGRWSIQKGRLTCYPIALFTGGLAISLSQPER